MQRRETMSKRVSLEYAKLALVASDQAYFDNSEKLYEQHVRHPRQNPNLLLPKGTMLAALEDVPRDATGLPEQAEYREAKLYQSKPPFAVPEGFNVVETIERPKVGAKAVIYRNEKTNETLIAFGGTDGPNAQDHTSNSQSYGFSQWTALNSTPEGKDPQKNENFGLLAKLEKYRGSEIIFTGQSLGGALAQYAMADYITQQYKLMKSKGIDYQPVNLHLSTYNSLGGKEAIEKNILLADRALNDDDSKAIRAKFNQLGSATHYVVDNDFVSKLGGGHIGTNGEIVMLDWKYLAGSSKGKPMDIADAHRIETAFYAHLNTQADELARGRVVKENSAQFKLIHTPNAVAWASKAAEFGNLNGVDTTHDAMFRLIKGLGGGHFGAPDEVNAVVKEVLTTELKAGKINPSLYDLANTMNDIYNPSANATIASRLVTSPIKTPLDALTVAAVGASTTAAIATKLVSKSPDYDPNYIDGYRYFEKEAKDGLGNTGDGRWYRSSPTPPYDNAWRNPAPPSEQERLSHLRDELFNRQWMLAGKSNVSDVVVSDNANSPTIKVSLGAERVAANIARGKSPDGIEDRDVWIAESAGKGHAWVQQKDGTLQRVEILQHLQGGATMTLMQYPKGSDQPVQIQQSSRDQQGNLILEVLIKLGENGEWCVENNKRYPSDAIRKDNPSPSGDAKVSDAGVSDEPLAMITVNQLAASGLAALQVSKDVPREYQSAVLEYLNARIAAQPHQIKIDIVDRITPLQQHA
jgi:hypothetical protein